MIQALCRWLFLPTSKPLELEGKIIRGIGDLLPHLAIGRADEAIQAFVCLKEYAEVRKQGAFIDKKKADCDAWAQFVERALEHGASLQGRRGHATGCR